MHDIFISYATEDRPRAERIARVLEGKGWRVWWDRQIPLGQMYDDVISQALDAARCVLVLWSRSSVTSSWVREEATEGADRHILIPVLMDDVAIPLGFRRIQAARLTDWNGSPDVPELLALF